MVVKRMSAHVLRGGEVCSAKTRQVASKALAANTAAALPTAAVTTAPVRMDGVARSVLMQLDAMAILVVNTAPVLPMVANARVPAPKIIMEMRARTISNAAATKPVRFSQATTSNLER